eukprot:8190821-Alexandrium_andersonii.AAC.1
MASELPSTATRSATSASELPSLASSESSQCLLMMANTMPSRSCITSRPVHSPPRLQPSPPPALGPALEMLLVHPRAETA